MDGHPDTTIHTTLRWHPRITPFRLAFVLSTTTLGIAKAVFVSKGDSIGSTTVEWVAGVVLALSFQFLGGLESFEHHGTVARFTFSQDCLAPLWSIMPRPSYTDDERHEAPSQAKDTADANVMIIVSPYRLLVSTVTVGFGAMKMACLYTGLSGAMNTLDWAFAVPISLLLYIVGLYENNTVHFARGFFEADYGEALTEVVVWASYIGLSLSSILLCSIWSPFWFRTFVHFIPQSLKSESPIADGTSPPFSASSGIGGTILSWMCGLHDQSYIVLVVCGGVVSSAFGIIPILFVSLYFWDETRWAGRRITRGARRISELRPHWPPITQEFTFMGMNTLHAAGHLISTMVLIVLQLAIIIVCLSSAILLVGLGFHEPMSGTTMSPHTNPVSVRPTSFAGVVAALCFSAASTVFFWAASQMTRTMLRPLVRMLITAAGSHRIRHSANPR
ncbi:hypothetical protein D9619_012526 [Psilocybe cf. subviscida]|uniref:Uncharacterized protein n=1 Tax=Psilocybe cf. subviscida TaxID=2480587 RepID=A0A8H5B745_9AGAR|nr:hypothetical protein D9619_012526 [Psilocybe cf. subviscida]